MARDRGHVNRSLVGLRVEGDELLALGTPVFAGGNELGKVTSCVLSPRLGLIALAYVRRGHQDAGTELQIAEGGRKAVVSSLPF